MSGGDLEVHTVYDGYKAMYALHNILMPVWNTLAFTSQLHWVFITEALVFTNGTPTKLEQIDLKGLLQNIARPWEGTYSIHTVLFN